MPLSAGAVAAADFDRDGRLDLFVTQFVDFDKTIWCGNKLSGKRWYCNPRLYKPMPCWLFHNNGDGTFTDVTAAAGVGGKGFGMGVTAGDFDNDGNEDLYITNYDSAILYHNNGDGNFSSVPEKAGILKPGPRFAIPAASYDFDNDGWPDIFVACDSTPNLLFRNNHDGTFTNVAHDVNVAYGANGDNTSSMGPIFGDYDNDGWQDLFVSDARYHRLFHNPGQPDGVFIDTTDEAGVSSVSGQYTAWGDGFFDFDNDGWKDLFVVNGGLNWLIPMESSLLRNNGNGTFSDISTEAGKFFEHRIVSRGACFADYDNDGYVDAFIVTLGGEGILLHNTPPAGKRNNWLTVRLVGTESNRDGYGASVEAFAGDTHQVVQAVSETGYLSQSDLRPHFGLGQHAEVNKLIIRWPSGIVQTLEHVKADQILTVKEPAGPIPVALKSNGK